MMEEVLWAQGFQRIETSKLKQMEMQKYTQSLSFFPLRGYGSSDMSGAMGTLHAQILSEHHSPLM